MESFIIDISGKEFSVIEQLKGEVIRKPIDMMNDILSRMNAIKPWIVFKAITDQMILNEGLKSFQYSGILILSLGSKGNYFCKGIPFTSTKVSILYFALKYITPVVSNFLI